MMIRPTISLMILIGTLVGGILNGFQLFSLDLFLAIVVVFWMVTGANALNDYIDRDIDKIVHSERAIPSGLLSPEENLHFTYVAFFIALLISLVIDKVSFLIVVFSIGLVVLYEKVFKEMALVGNSIVAFFGGFSFIFGGLAVGKPLDPILLAVMAFLIMLGREILMDVRDVEGDVLKRVTLPMKIDKKNAAYIGCICIVVTIALTPLPPFFGILSWWYIFIMIPTDLIFIYAIFLALHDLKNIGITTDMLRTGSALGLIGFIVGIVT